MGNNETLIKSSARDIFLHLLGTVMLIVSVIGLLTLLFGYFDEILPDTLTYYQAGNLDRIRIATSIVIVVFPVYIFIAWILGRDYKKNPAKRNIRARRVFMYLTLFASAITFIISLITLIYRFYSGDLTTQFVLKIVSVLAVAAAVFGYFLWDIRRRNFESKKPKLFAWIAGGAMLVIVAAGFFIVGSPAKQRDIRFDDTRVQNLQAIQDQIIGYWQKKDKLPATLNDLTDSISGFVAPQDPETKTAYGYKITGTLAFELCANFKTSGQTNGASPYEPIIRTSPYNYNWNHAAGLVCFSRAIDSQLYKNPAPKPI